MAAVENPDLHPPVACDFLGERQFRSIKPMTCLQNIGLPGFGARQGRMSGVLSYYVRVAR